MIKRYYLFLTFLDSGKPIKIRYGIEKLKRLDSVIEKKKRFIFIYFIYLFIFTQFLHMRIFASKVDYTA